MIPLEDPTISLSTALIWPQGRLRGYCGGPHNDHLSFGNGECRPNARSSQPSSMFAKTKIDANIFILHRVMKLMLRSGRLGSVLRISTATLLTL